MILLHTRCTHRYQNQIRKNRKQNAFYCFEIFGWMVVMVVAFFYWYAGDMSGIKIALRLFATQNTYFVNKLYALIDQRRGNGGRRTQKRTEKDTIYEKGPTSSLNRPVVMFQLYSIGSSAFVLFVSAVSFYLFYFISPFFFFKEVITQQSPSEHIRIHTFRRAEFWNLKF